MLSTNVGKYNLWKLFPVKFGTVCFHSWIFTIPLLVSMALSLADSASDIWVEIWLLEVISLCASFSCSSFFCRFVHSWVICSCNCDSRSKLSFSPEIKKIFQSGRWLLNRIIQKCEILWDIYNAKTKEYYSLQRQMSFRTRHLISKINLAWETSDEKTKTSVII